MSTTYAANITRISDHQRAVVRAVRRLARGWRAADGVQAPALGPVGQEQAVAVAQIRFGVGHEHLHPDDRGSPEPEPGDRLLAWLALLILEVGARLRAQRPARRRDVMLPKRA